MAVSKIHMDSGEKYGSLTYLGVKKNENKRWLGEFLCECGQKRFIRFDCVVRGIYKSCGCKGHSTGYKQRRQALADDYPFHVLLTLFRKNSKKRKLEFNIDIADLKHQYESQGRKCIYTKRELIMPPSFLGIYNENVASIDRIDSDLGYIRGNIQLVTKKINMMKQCLSHDEFISICKLVTRHA